MSGIVAALAEFGRELMVERTRAGLASARARGRSGGRPFKMTAAKLRHAQAAMGQPGTKMGEGSVLDGQLAPGMEVIGKPFALEALAARVQAMLEAEPGAPAG